jgi:hypothetical protein
VTVLSHHLLAYIPLPLRDFFLGGGGGRGSYASYTIAVKHKIYGGLLLWIYFSLIFLHDHWRDSTECAGLWVEFVLNAFILLPFGNILLPAFEPHRIDVISCCCELSEKWCCRILVRGSVCICGVQVFLSSPPRPDGLLDQPHFWVDTRICFTGSKTARLMLECAEL